MTDIAQRMQPIAERIAQAAHHAGRDPADVAMIAVTKTHAAEVVAQAVAAGLYDLGENRVQEAEPKIAALSAQHPAPRWHLIGHLQRNKARRAVQLFDMVHSLDSLRLAQALDRHMREQATPTRQRLPVLLQVNVSGEASKEGFALPGGVANRDQVPPLLAAIEQILALPHLHVQGLMTVAPLLDDPQAARPVFQALRSLRDMLAQQFPQADWHHLSMGMTDDFEVAIEEGATLVRIGRALFGERPTPA